MIVVRDLLAFTARETFAVTLGNFDGIHVGHQEILRRLKEIAGRNGLTSGIFTFSPHPLRYFGADVKRILTDRKKTLTFAEHNVDYLFVVPFNKMFAEMDPEVFVREFLVKKLNVKFIIVGYDYSFGRNRSGNFRLLQTLSAKYGFTAIQIPRIDQEGMTVSSTNIRKFLTEGEVEKAAAFLGRPFSLEGNVERGDGLGNRMGYPTVNISTDNELIPKPGVYASYIHTEKGGHRSITYIGSRPTVSEDGKTRIETFIFDFSGNLYDTFVEVELHAYIRGDMKFDDMDALKAQIDKDCERARAIIGSTRT